MKTFAFAATMILLSVLALPAQTKSTEPKWERTVLKDNTYHAETYRYDNCHVHVRRGNTGLDLNAYDPAYRGVGLTHIVNIDYKDSKVDVKQHWAPNKQEMVLSPDIRSDVFGNKCGSALHLLPANVLRLFGGFYGFPKR